jgi:hypothetical protein
MDADEDEMAAAAATCAAASAIMAACLDFEGGRSVRMVRMIFLMSEGDCFWACS